MRPRWRFWTPRIPAPSGEDALGGTRRCTRNVLSHGDFARHLLQAPALCQPHVRIWLTTALSGAPLPDDAATFFCLGSLIAGLVWHPQEHRGTHSVVPARWRQTPPIPQFVPPFRLTFPTSKDCTAHRRSPQNSRVHVLSCYWPRDPATQRPHPAALLRSGAPPRPTAPRPPRSASHGGSLPASPPTWSRSGACAPRAAPRPLPGPSTAVPPPPHALWARPVRQHGLRHRDPPL